MEGYESFWACNDGAGNQRQGLNGVCTFVRKDLMVERACNTPLDSEELDAEGLRKSLLAKFCWLNFRGWE